MRTHGMREPRATRTEAEGDAAQEVRVRMAGENGAHFLLDWMYLRLTEGVMDKVICGDLFFHLNSEGDNAPPLLIKCSRNYLVAKHSKGDLPSHLPAASNVPPPRGGTKRRTMRTGTMRSQPTPTPAWRSGEGSRANANNRRSRQGPKHVQHRGAAARRDAGTEVVPTGAMKAHPASGRSAKADAGTMPAQQLRAFLAKGRGCAEAPRW